MIDPDGNEWTVGRPRFKHCVRLECRGAMMNTKQDQQERNGWRLKEESDE